MRYIIAFSALAAVVVGLVAAGAWYFRPPAEESLSPRDRAAQLLAECKWQETIDACDALLSQFPDDGEVWLWRGRSRLAIDQFDAATADFTEAIARLPKDPEPRYFRAMAYERLGKVDEANADFETAQQLDPTKDMRRLAVLKEEAAREVQSMVRESNRTAGERADKRLEARHAKSEARVAALHEDAIARRIAQDEKSAAKQSHAQAKTEDASDAPASASAPSAAFDRLTSEDFFEKPAISFGPLPTSPDNLLASKASPENSLLPANPSDLGGESLWKELSQQSGTLGEKRPATPPSDPTGPPAANDPAANSATDVSVPLSAWERFRQNQETAAPRETKLSTPSIWPSKSIFSHDPQGIASHGIASQGIDRQNRSTVLPETAKTQGIRPGGAQLRRSWSGVSENPAGSWLNGPLAARVASGQPLSTAQPSPQLRRGPENAFSTAILPLPAPALDKNMAHASAPPGILSMAIHELYPPSAATFGAPLTTQTAPLPAWVMPLTGTAPNRR
jgi:tetratricopeptide (TPR) repeat protein